MGLRKRQREQALMHLLLIVGLILFSLIVSGKAKADEATVKQLSTIYNIDATLIQAIINVESSGCKFKVNKVSGDYGCMQINVHNIQALKLDKARLVRDNKYAIAQGVRILNSFKRFQSQDGSLWICRYNVGTGKLTGKRFRNCIKYATKVNAEMAKLNAKKKTMWAINDLF